MRTDEGSTMHPLTSKPRDERGEGLLGTLVGAAVGLVVLAGVVLFLTQSNAAKNQTVDNARTEAAAVEAVNRIVRDVAGSARVLEANDTEVVVQRTLSSDSHVRIFYGVTDGDLVTRRISTPEDAAYDPGYNWATEDVKTLVTDVTSDPLFTYVDRNGQNTNDPTQVRLVEVNLDATTEGDGNIALKASAAVDSGAGTVVGATRRVDPVAVADQRSFTRTGPSTWTLTYNVLTNDTCNSNTPCIAADLEDIRLINPSHPGGWTVSLSATGLLTIETNTQPNSDVTLTYAIRDEYGSSEATITARAVVAPNALPDRVDFVRDVSGNWLADVNVLTNDTCWNSSTSSSTSPCSFPHNTFTPQIQSPFTVTKPADWTVTWTGGVMRISAPTRPSGGQSVTYRISDSQGDATSTVTANEPLTPVAWGAYRHGENVVSFRGGRASGYTVTTVDAATGAHIGTVCAPSHATMPVCSDALPGTPNVFDVSNTGRALDGTTRYRVSDGTGNTFLTANIRQFPADVITRARGSERGGKYTPLRGSNLVSAWATSTSTAPRFGLRAYNTRFHRPTVWGGTSSRTIDESSVMDLGVINAPAYTHTGRAASSETIYKAYGVNNCVRHPNSPIALVDGYCPSPQESLPLTYANTTTAWTHNHAGNWGARVYQAPSTATVPNNDGTDSVTIGDNIPGYVGGDSCNDVGNEAGDNRVYSCDTRQAYLRFRSLDWESNAQQPCLGTNPGNCTVEVRKGASAASTGSTSPLVMNASTSSLDLLGYNAGHVTLNAETYGGNEGVAIYLCNIGGCSTPDREAVRSYPEKVTFTSAVLTRSPNQYKRYSGPLNFPHKDDETDANNCWVHTPDTAGGSLDASCTKNQVGQIFYQWTNALGASEYRIDSDMLHKVLFTPDADTNTRLKNWPSTPPRQRVEVNPGDINTISVRSVAPVYGGKPGLWQETSRLTGVPVAGASFMQTSPVYRPGVDQSQGWRWGMQWRPNAGFASVKANGDYLSPTSDPWSESQWSAGSLVKRWDLFWWTGARERAFDIYVDPRCVGAVTPGAGNKCPGSGDRRTRYWGGDTGFFGGALYDEYFGGMARMGRTNTGAPASTLTKNIPASGQLSHPNNWIRPTIPNNIHNANAGSTAEAFETYRLTYGDTGMMRTLSAMLLGGNSSGTGTTWLPHVRNWTTLAAVQPWTDPNEWAWGGEPITVAGTLNSGWGRNNQMGSWRGTSNIQTNGTVTAPYTFEETCPWDDVAKKFNCSADWDDIVHNMFGGAYAPWNASAHDASYTLIPGKQNSAWYAVGNGQRVTRRVSRPDSLTKNPNPDYNNNQSFGQVVW